jgi:hypothetical protein
MTAIVIGTNRRLNPNRPLTTSETWKDCLTTTLWGLFTWPVIISGACCQNTGGASKGPRDVLAR